MYMSEVEGAAATIPLPPAYSLAPPERQRAYRAGRHCARLVLAQLGVPDTVPGISETGGPAWPHGTVGSITHALGIVAAAAAPGRHCVALGIDIEPIMSLEKAHQRGAQIASSLEIFEAMNAAHLDYASAVALIVAAKHSVYKALHPVVHRSFSYLDVAIDHVDMAGGRFRARLKLPLSRQWPAGTTVVGRIQASGDFIYSGMAVDGC
jgi:enterobactin synthetase component D